MQFGYCAINHEAGHVLQGGPIDKRISVSCIREFSLIRADFLRFLAVFCEILAHGVENRLKIDDFDRKSTKSFS